MQLYHSRTRGVGLMTIAALLMNTYNAYTQRLKINNWQLYQIPFLPLNHCGKFPPPRMEQFYTIQVKDFTRAGQLTSPKIGGCDVGCKGATWKKLGCFHSPAEVNLHDHRTDESRHTRKWLHKTNCRCYRRRTLMHNLNELKAFCCKMVLKQQHWNIRISSIKWPLELTVSPQKDSKHLLMKFWYLRMNAE